MTLLELAQSHVPMRRVGSEWHGPCPRCGHGPKSSPQTSDRFSVKASGMWFCRSCGHGDDVAFLREFEGKTCPEAHAALGKECRSTTCPVIDKCSQRDGSGGPRIPRPRPLRAPKPAAAPEFVPAAAVPPAERWRQSAQKVIERAHAALLEAPEQLDYLARRGLPRAAVERYRLGWLAQDLYRPRAAWGQPEILREDGKPKKFWLPAGIVIPFFDAHGNPIRLRIRRPKVKEGEARYYWVPGSGDDVPVLGADARAFVVVESDLDALLVHYHAEDLVGTIPLGTCSAKPKEHAVAVLRNALAILVALDFEPRENPTTGRHENPGGQAAFWWVKHFPRAKRWPVPVGKDPGDFVKDHSGDIRAWVLAGLPPVFHVAVSVAVSAPVQPPTPAAEQPEETASAPQPEASAPPDHNLVGYMRGVSRGGIPYIVANAPDILARVREVYPGEAPFLREEIQYLQGLDPAAIDAILRERTAVVAVFPDAEILGVRPIVGDGRARSFKYDPSRQRRVGR